MAPLPVDSTARYKIIYTNSGKQHVQDIRYVGTLASFDSELAAVWSAMSAQLKATVIDDVQFAALGSNVFNSVASSLVSNTYGSGVGTVPYVGLFNSFIGRSSGGRRARIYFFGAVDTGTDYRYVAGENAAIDATVALLNAVGSGIVAIDNLKPVWKTYANGGYNAYWQRESRP